MKMLRILSSILFISTLLFSCQPTTISEEKPIFEIPCLYNSSIVDTSKLVDVETTNLLSAYPQFVGRFPFSVKEVDVSPILAYDTIYYEKHLHTLYPSQGREKMIARGSAGLEIFVDFKQTIYYNDLWFCGINKFESFYPLFIVNNNRYPKLLFGKDDYMFGLQEARIKRDKGPYSYPEWEPIETKAMSMCGNGKWELIIYPNEYVVLLMKKYHGDYKTDLRIRIKNEHIEMLSEPFTGSICSSQIYPVSDEECQFPMPYVCEKHIYDRSFFGAKPNYKSDEIIVPME